ncbi:MAG: hypothetical protein EBX52_09310 [Proteobacteria bacterium]|nr:hypothetical protein [Pseudomonadota bacterium]
MLLSCGPSGRATHAPGTPFESSRPSGPEVPSREKIARLREELENYEFVGSADDRPREFNPEAVLPRIHPWLAPGKGLKEASFGGTRAFLLGKIPQEVLKQLETSLYPDSTPVPLMILRASFWVRAETMQSKGIQIGFKSYVPHTTDAGIYLSEPETLLFDTFAEYGTLTHEIEHSLQQKKNRSLTRNESPGSPLSARCLDSFGRFLAEVDATTEELPEWLGVFSTFDYKPERYRPLHDPEGLDFHSFHDALLMANLNYPSYAAHWVSTSDCPAALLDAAVRISIESQEFMQKAHAATLKLHEIRARFGWACIHANTLCRNPASANALELCAEDREFLGTIDELAKTAIKNIDEVLETGYEDRTRKTREILNGLPVNLKETLCRSTGAFSFLGECP